MNVTRFCISEAFAYELFNISILFILFYKQILKKY